ncbi:hypothetical protein HMPREF9944_00652 [Segatella maculosa OT 289]|uniref:Uncharacterized protein n=1 Tax=Segatella maculosa OT 289 TaxID=999422 RepID=H1HKF8_9BACT|nr:hypothetical protein HMPREF9944_00652 [Segatella maculosa OT 289]
MRTHVGTHGSCVRSNQSCIYAFIPLEWTHEPCVPATYMGHIDA